MPRQKLVHTQTCTFFLPTKVVTKAHGTYYDVAGLKQIAELEKKITELRAILIPQAIPRMLLISIAELWYKFTYKFANWAVTCA